MPTEALTQINTLTVVGNLDPSTQQTELRFADGLVVRVPTALLQQQASMEPQATSLSSDDAMLIPLVEEKINVSKRTVETGRVYLHKTSEAFDVNLDESLAVNTWKVERVPMHQVVAEAPPPRQEGSTTIYPLVEERLIVTKELVLIEEIYVTRELYERRGTHTVTLRRETLSVERDTPQQS